jgi:KipI family sensor histidine kinase inhibitor
MGDASGCRWRIAFLMQEFGAPNLRRIGQSTIVLEFDDASAAMQQRLWALARVARSWAHIGEAVIGAGNLSVVFNRDAIAYEAVRVELEAAWERTRGDKVSERTIEIAVRYGGDDGADLRDVAQACGLREDEAIALHAAATYVVAFVGFLPGFAYLDGLDERLRLPRRAQPRTRVPAGSVAIAGAQSGVYPFDSPGGWHIIGRTAQRMFDPEREPAALLQPVDRVRFVPV